MSEKRNPITGKSVHLIVYNVSNIMNVSAIRRSTRLMEANIGVLVAKAVITKSLSQILMNMNDHALYVQCKRKKNQNQNTKFFTNINLINNS